MGKTRILRASKELSDMISYIKAKYMIEGKIPPTTASITRAICKKVRKEDLLKDEFIRFK